MKEVCLALTGRLTPAQFIMAMFFALLGFLIYKFVTAKKRNKNSPRTPWNWDWSFWLRDNIIEFLAVGVELYVLVRFTPEILANFAPDTWAWLQGSDIMFMYLIMGYFMTYITKKLRRVYLEYIDNDKTKP